MRIAVCVLLAACGGDLDPPWQLDHDRIVAVRATPPGIAAAGETSRIDALLAAKSGRTSEAAPLAGQVISPMSLASVFVCNTSECTVTMPSDAALAAARAELRLPADAPVPLQIGVGYVVNGVELAALKIVWLGEARANPTLDQMMIDGSPLDTMTELVVPRLVEVRFSVDAIQEDDVNWLTNVGTMHDFDLPQSYLVVEEDEDLTMGELAVVKRVREGGVVWRVWPIRVE